MGPAASAVRTFTKEGLGKSFPRFLHIIREAKQRNRLILISRTAGWWHVNAASATTFPLHTFGGTVENAGLLKEIYQKETIKNYM